MIEILPAPSSLGLGHSGVQDLPQALLRHGLARRLQAAVQAPVPVPAADGRRDPEDGIRNKAEVAAYTVALADRVGSVLDDGAFPVVLGGDCSIVLGPLLALRRRGRHGLLFLDGHADLYQPEANVNGEAASSELAFATGRGPAMLTRFEGHARLVQDEDVVLMGQRDAAEAARYGSRDVPPGMKHCDLDGIRRRGAVAAAADAVRHLALSPRQGYWVHLDVDVLDDDVMPAVGYRMPGGLAWEELDVVLRAACRGPACLGLDVTIYDPHLDDVGAGRRLVEHLHRGLEPRLGGR